MGWRVAGAILNNESSSRSDELPPLEKGEQSAGIEYGPAASSESEEGNE